MPTNELIALFNSFETFSFEEHDYPDDSVIIIQILNLFHHQRNMNHLAVELKSRYCGQCNDAQSICTYNDSKSKYMCNKCCKRDEYINSKSIQCQECKALYDKVLSTNYLITPCCQRYYCILCLKTLIKSKEQNANVYNDLGMITCFCNKGFERQIITSIIENEIYKDLFDFSINFLNPEPDALYICNDYDY